MPNATPTTTPDETVITRELAKTERPRRWKVLLHNDDYTTMEFVVYVLVKHFQKSSAEATHVMLSVHHKGVGVAGIYPRDIAETKVSQAMDFAKENGQPLLVTAEPEE